MLSGQQCKATGMCGVISATLAHTVYLEHPLPVSTVQASGPLEILHSEEAGS